MWRFAIACHPAEDTEIVDTDVVDDTDVDPWTTVDAALDAAFAVNDVQIPGLGLRVYDANDELVHAHVSGTFSFGDRIAVASASKLVSGLVLLRLAHEGALSLDTTTGERLGWIGEGGEVTLDHLGAFTSGLEPEDTCMYQSRLTLEECVAQIAEAPRVAAPGDRFDYGGTHLQVAGRMAEVATGQSWHALFTSRLAEPLGLTDPGLVYTSLPQTETTASPNPLVAGGLRVTPTAYVKFLALAFHEGEIDGATWIEPTLVARLGRNAYTGAVVGDRPESVVPLDYRYGFASWLACSGPVATCPVVTSPGAFGFTPWFDREHGYYAILAMESPDPGAGGFSVPLLVELQPGIVAALGR